MPMLVRTPEEIFRTEKKDLYVLVSQEKSADDEFISSSSKPPKGLRMIEGWLKENMPDAAQELLAPSEYSGVICGGIGGTLRVDFSPEQLQQFCARWEKNDKSVDPRFQCFIIPYQRWYDEHGRFVPTMDKPTQLGLTIWWYTPSGFIHHQISLDEAQKNGWEHHPANHHDIWAKATELWPHLAVLDTAKLTYGSIMQSTQKSGWFALYTLPIWRDAPGALLPTAIQIRDWFQLPAEVELIEDSY